MYNYGGLCRVTSTARERVSPRRDHEASVRVARKGHGTGRVRQGRDVEFQKWQLRFVEGRDMRWKILKQAWVMGRHGLEFQCSVTWSVTAP